MLIPSKHNGYSPDGSRRPYFGIGEAALAGTLAAGATEAGAAAGAGMGALGAAEGIGALGTGALGAEGLTALGGGLGALAPGVGASLLTPELLASGAINAAAPGITTLGSALPGMANPLAGLNLTGALTGAVPESVASAGSLAGNAASNIAPVANTGITLKDIGQGASLASNAYSLGNKLLGGNQQPSYYAPLQPGRPVGESQMPSPLSQSIIAAPQVADPFGQSIYSNYPTKHFDDGGGVWGAPEGDVSYDQSGNLMYDRSSDLNTPTYNNTPTQAEIDEIRNGKDTSSLWDWFKKKDPKTGETVYDWGKIGMLGLGGAGLMSLMSKPSLLPMYQPKTAQQYGLGATLSKNYRPTRPMAEGGLTAPGILALNNPYSNEPNDNISAADGGLMGSNIYPMSQQNVSQYATPSQLPTGAHEVAQEIRGANMNRMASGGISSLGSYSDGGRMLKGPGDGMSDNIPATIAGKQPARLADGEFVMPADVVSHLGNGSTDAGAKKLYAMMDNVRKARTGTKKQGKRINPDKYMPV